VVKKTATRDLYDPSGVRSGSLVGVGCFRRRRRRSGDELEAKAKLIGWRWRWRLSTRPTAER